MSEVLKWLAALVRSNWNRRKETRFSRAITLLDQILDGGGYGEKDKGSDTWGKQCVPRTWLVARCDELDEVFESLGIDSFYISKTPKKAHVAGYLFRMKELLENGNLGEARRYSTEFISSLRSHPWDRDNRYVKNTCTFVDSTAMEDAFVNRSPT